MSNQPALWGVAWQVATEKWIGRCDLCIEHGPASTEHSVARRWLQEHFVTDTHRAQVAAYRTARRVGALRSTTRAGTGT